MIHIAILIMGVSCASHAPSTPLRPEARARSAYSAMSERQRIAQHFIGWIPSSGVTAETEAIVRAGHIGGFILYPWNYDSESAVIELTGRLQRSAAAADPPVGLFLAADQEGGRVAAFRFRETTAFPPAFFLGRYGDPEVTRAAAYIAGVELRSLGLNMNLAPVLDLHAKADRSIIGDRSFGNDPQIVTAVGRAYLRGAAEAGIIAVAKHFPGHGMTVVDSHGALPVVDTDVDALYAHDLQPFAGVIESGVEALMTAHILFRAIDPVYPATLSTFFMQELLRDTLGFSGVVMSDGLSMGALAANYSVEETVERCFTVGVDILLVHNRYDVSELIDMAEALLAEGKINRTRFAESTLSILELKARHGLIPAVE